MKLPLLILLLLSGAARGEPPEDAPLIQSVPGGYFVNEPGMIKLNTELAEIQRQRSELIAQNSRLTYDIRAAASRPALTWQSALLLVGGGLVVGAAATAIIMVGAH